MVVTYDDQMVLLVDETLRGLAELTQLHFLRIMINAVDDLAPRRFLPLTSLTALTSLELVHSDPDGRQQEEEFRAKVSLAHLSMVRMQAICVLHHATLLPPSKAANTTCLNQCMASARHWL